MQWTDVDAELLTTLPPVLRAVVKALGFVRAKEWLQDHGGVNVNIPFHKDRALDLEPDELDRMRIALAPHMDAAGRVWMTKADKLLQLSRNVCIQRGKLRESIREQARAYGLSSRMITIIRNDCDDDKQQFDLF